MALMQLIVERGTCCVQALNPTCFLALYQFFPACLGVALPARSFIRSAALHALVLILMAAACLPMPLV